MTGGGEMNVFVGIDLGSTTTKAVIIDENEEIIGRGITNSRSNYDVACKVAREEAFIQARFSLTRDAILDDPDLSGLEEEFLPDLENGFRLQQHLGDLGRLRESLHEAAAAPRHFAYQAGLVEIVDGIVDDMTARAPELYSRSGERKSDFFRDLASAEYMDFAADRSDPKGITFDILCGVFDAAILTVENSSDVISFDSHIETALERLIPSSAAGIRDRAEQLRRAVSYAGRCEIKEKGIVGTGYGRQRMPFPKEQIRSEILCHGLGAHKMFPGTSTVLDIGGQDTKAIQVDGQGIVTSFQMNDRCAAGCGRYLGYIADEMNLGLHELGPLAQRSTHHVKINSTCTVFAGAELRDRLGMGQRREDILAGLHRAIMLRAMSLLARSGGIHDQFTFTGGVAKNPAAVEALQDLVKQNYGERALNISPDSIYTGALGGALFALRDHRGDHGSAGEEPR